MAGTLAGWAAARLAGADRLRFAEAQAVPLLSFTPQAAAGAWISALLLRGTGPAAVTAAAAAALTAAAGPRAVPCRQPGATGPVLRVLTANLLAGRASVAPLDVPVEVLGRLAWPSGEDWFVWTPAMAAVAELVRCRPDACVILESLAASDDARDRYEAAATLLGVARIQAAAVPAALAGQLAGDADPLVAAKGQEVVTTIEQAADPERAGRRPSETLPTLHAVSA